ACHFKVENPVEPNNHAQTGKNLRVILERQARKAKQPLRVEHRVHAPRQIVATSQDKDDPVETPPCHHAHVSSCTSSRPVVEEPLLGAPRSSVASGAGLEPGAPRIMSKNSCGDALGRRPVCETHVAPATSLTGRGQVRSRYFKVSATAVTR